MAEIALHNYDLACDVICTLDYSEVEKFRQNENELNFLNREIARFVVKLSKLELNDQTTPILQARSTRYPTSSAWATMPKTS